MRRSYDEPTSRFERFLFRFMGPPQIGDLDEPARPGPAVQEACPICHRAYEEHGQSASNQGGYTSCPA